MMRVSCPHRWDVTPEEAIEIQRQLAPQVIDEDVVPDLLSSARYVAGVDVHQAADGKMRAVVCVLTFPSLTVEEYAYAEVEVSFPYIPGLLAFREGPAVLKAFEKLNVTPDFILWDAQGRAHQRRLGLASQMGLILDIPSVGCAKSILYGEWTEPRDEVGAWTPIIDPKDGDVIGATVRTKRAFNRCSSQLGTRSAWRQPLSSCSDAARDIAYQSHCAARISARRNNRGNKANSSACSNGIARPLTSAWWRCYPTGQAHSCAPYARVPVWVVHQVGYSVAAI